MWHEAVPEMQGEVGVAAAQAGNEVILVSLDCTFCGVGAVKVWGNELELDTGFAQKSFEADGEFIVQNLVLEGEAAVREVGVEDARSSYEFLFVTRGECLRQYGVASVVI